MSVGELLGWRGPCRTPWGYLFLISLVALIGFILCLNLLWAYAGDPKGMLTNEWFCGGQNGLEYGCSGVFASRFGKPWGIPLPAFGAIYFGTVLVWFLVFGRQSFNFFLALFFAGGAAVSLGLLFILFFVLPGQCRWCLLVHLINGAMIVAALLAFSVSRSFFDFRPLLFKLTRACLVGFIMLTLTGWTSAVVFKIQADYMKKEYEAVRLSECFQRGLYAQQKARIIKITPDDHILGLRSAPVKIVAYQDYQCDHCLKASKILKTAVNRLNQSGKQNNLCLVVRQYPLSRRCNPHYRSDYHPYSCAAARAAEAVAIAGGEPAFWKYHELLHNNFEELDQSPYAALAAGLGIPEKSFLAALKTPRVQSKIKTDIETLHDLGFSVVPTIFINGRHVDGWQVPGFIEQLAREELRPFLTAPPP
jgi:protein-disulfide isomerase/uncharacterized membrane protein